ncbi:TetR/AcrR family transcriptional regulator [Methylocapsa sp. S129]|uniref:TetR/AcrR family transcriptional regulator n=1 Tax=Methylocapsa sp. S129 TaxID=1641869 RepID=UPI00131AF50D|nr:TetR/AcrR family transcriptional regulator [Methylocapsa sp. S129]
MPKISERQRESRRQQILEAALGCFSENGFHQTGMADIVQRSGMSHGAVYGYFESKDDIIEALADDRHRSEAILNSAAEQAEDPIEGLRALVRAYAHGLTDPAGEPRRRVGVHGWAEALRSPRVHARVVEGIDIPRSMIAGLVAQAQRMGRLPDDLGADAIARSFIAVFQGFVLQVAWGEEIDVAACVAVIDRMLQGLAQGDRQARPGGSA